MKVGIFFFTIKPVRTEVRDYKAIAWLGGTAFVRMEVVDCSGVSRALEMAGDRMRPGESVMNTHELEKR